MIIEEKLIDKIIKTAKLSNFEKSKITMALNGYVGKEKLDNIKKLDKKKKKYQNYQKLDNRKIKT